MNTAVVISLGFLCLSVIISRTLAQDTSTWPATTTFVPNPGLNLEDEAQTTTSEPSEAPIVEHNVLQLDPVIERSSHVHYHSHEDPTLKGFWTKKFAWRPRWVKTWQEKKVYVAVWKRMWGPVVVKEWVPVPKPPPGWVKHDARTPSYVKKFHGK